MSVNLRRWFKAKPSTLEIGKEISRGSYGVVYLAQMDKKQVAVKKIHKILLENQQSQHLIDNFVQECENMKALNHPNVVGFIGAYYEGNEPLLVMELMHESLEGYVKRSRNMSLKRQLEVVHSIAEGLKYLHHRKNPIIHRDLSDKNVLLLADGTVKISDLGQAKLLSNPSQFLMTTQPGTVAYLPPEALAKGGKYTAKVDAFSLGVLMLEVTTQHQPQVQLVGIGTQAEVVRRADDLKLLDSKHVLKPLIVWCFQECDTRPDVAAIHFHLSSFITNNKVREDKENLEEIAQARKEHEHGLVEQLQKMIVDRDEIKAAKDALSTEVSKQKSTIKGLENSLTDTESEKKVLSRHLENSKRDNRELERKVKDLQERLNTANASIRTYRNEEGRLKRDLQAAERRVDTEQAGLRRELTLKEQQFDSKVAQHAREMGHKDSLIQRHMATIGDRDEQIAKMKKEAEELRKRLKEHEDEKVKMTKNQKELEGEKASLETTIISLRTEIFELQERYEDLEVEVKDRRIIERDLWKHSRDYLDKKIDMMAKINDYKAYVEKLQSRNQKLATENKRLAIEIARLKLYDPDDVYLTPEEEEEDKKELKRSSWWPFGGSTSPKKGRAKSDGNFASSSSPRTSSPVDTVISSSIDSRLQTGTEGSESLSLEKDQQEALVSPPSQQPTTLSRLKKRHPTVPLADENTASGTPEYSKRGKDQEKVIPISPSQQTSKLTKRHSVIPLAEEDTISGSSEYDRVDSSANPHFKERTQLSSQTETVRANQKTVVRLTQRPRSPLKRVGSDRRKSSTWRSKSEAPSYRNPRTPTHACPECGRDISTATSPTEHIRKCKIKRNNLTKEHKNL